MNEKELVETLTATLARLRSSDKKFSKSDCPLNVVINGESHYHLARMVFGSGCWGWTCKFCGLEEED
jgi:hypothetical protein